MENQKSKIKNQNYGAKYKTLRRAIIFAFCFVILHFTFYILHLSEATAQGSSLRVAPSILQIKLHPPTQINAPVIIENPADTPITVHPQLRLFHASDAANGQIEYVSDQENKSPLFSFIRLEDKDQVVDTLTIGPRQKKELHLIIRVDADQTSDTYFSVIFLPQAQKGTFSDQSSFSNIQAGVAMNVILSPLRESKRPTGTIEAFSSPKVLEKGPVDFSIKIQNNSSNYIKPKGTILITNMFGQTIGKVDLPPSTILANSSRYLGVNALPNKQPVTTWNESILFGFYDAKLSLSLSPDGPMLTKTIHFTALPIRFLVGFVVAILLVLTIYHRVKEKMSGK